MKKVIDYFRKDLYKLNLKNVIIVSMIDIIATVLFEYIKIILTSNFYINIGLNLKVDFLAIYSSVIGLMIPLAILVIEKFSKKIDYILSTTYLKATYMFPIIIYYSMTLIIFLILEDQYYFIFSILISIIMLIYMYYIALKLLSDVAFENRKLNEVYHDLIDEDIKIKLKNYDTDNKIKEFSKYGIVVQGLDYLNVLGYSKITVKSSNSYEIIEKYNYKTINELIHIIEKENKDYIEQSNCQINQIKGNEIHPNIIIILNKLGDTLNVNDMYATIYYNNSVSKEQINLLSYKVSNNIYYTNKLNFSLYVKNNGSVISKECIQAINNESSLELEKALTGYMFVYENFIYLIRDYLGDYSYDIAYQQTHSFLEPKVYEIFKWIKNDIYEYTYKIRKKNDFKMMNEVTSFLYRLILFSYNNFELFSIQYMFNTYEFLNNESLNFKEKYTKDKIKLELFEFINFVLYDLDNNKNAEFCKNVLLICNKTIINITKSMFLKDNNLFQIYMIKLKKFIENLNEKINRLKHGDNEATINLKNKLIDVVEHYESNIFAMNAYLLKDIEKEGKNPDVVIAYYKDYGSDKISKIYLKTNWLDFNDNTYHWDIWEEHDLDRAEGMWNVNTSHYITHLYCLILNKKKNENIKIPIDANLAETFDAYIKQEFISLDNTEIINKFEDMKIKVKELEKEYLRTANISQEKVEIFKSNFIKYYEEHSDLLKIMKRYNNYEIVDIKNEEEKYLGTNTIMEKTYFLDKFPNNKNIIFLDFEGNFAESFIQGETKRYIEYLSEKSNIEEDKLSELILSNYSNSLNEIIILANYRFEYEILDIDKVKYHLEKDETSIDSENSMYFLINNVNIPVYQIDGLDNNYYVVNINKMGKMQKLSTNFEIDITDFSNNEEKLNQLMKEDIKGINLTSDEKKIHLLESVNVLIREYVSFYFKELDSNKFAYLEDKDDTLYR